MKNFKLKWFSLVLGCIFAVSLVATAQAQKKEYSSLLYEVLDRGFVRIATGSDKPPFYFIDEKTKQLTGFDIAIGKLLAKGLFGDENKVEFVVIKRDERIPIIISGKADCVIRSTGILPERLIKVAFTQNYQDAGTCIMVSNDLRVDKIEELNTDKVIVGTGHIPVWIKWLEVNLPKAKVLRFDGTATTFQAMRSKRINATLEETIGCEHYVAKNPGVARILKQVFQDQNGIMMKHGDFVWWKFLDGMVDLMRHGYLFPEYDEIHRKWLEVPAPPPNWYSK